jgi:uncharacterized protein YjiS (DUF1127 family)
MLCRCEGPPSIYRGVHAPEPLMTILIRRRRQLGDEAVYDGSDRTAASRIARCRRTIARWIARSRQRHALREIAESNDFHLLKDIGVSQEEAFREADKPFWRP